MPEEPEGYQPTEQDWAEYHEWAEGHRTECCPVHNHQDPDNPCPECEDEAWAAAWAAGEEPDDDGWYFHLLMQASHGHYNPHFGWRVEQ